MIYVRIYNYSKAPEKQFIHLLLIRLVKALTTVDLLLQILLSLYIIPLLISHPWTTRSSL